MNAMHNAIAAKQRVMRLSENSMDLLFASGIIQRFAASATGFFSLAFHLRHVLSFRGASSSSECTRISRKLHSHYAKDADIHIQTYLQLMLTAQYASRTECALWIVK
jgi:hypothetical protein